MQRRTVQAFGKVGLPLALCAYAREILINDLAPGRCWYLPARRETQIDPLRAMRYE